MNFFLFIFPSLKLLSAHPIGIIDVSGSYCNQMSRDHLRYWAEIEIMGVGEAKALEVLKVKFSGFLDIGNCYQMSLEQKVKDKH